MKSPCFLYFEDSKSNKIKVAYAPGYYFGDEFDDIVIRFEISNCNVSMSIVREETTPEWMIDDEYDEYVYNIEDELNTLGINDALSIFFI